MKNKSQKYRNMKIKSVKKKKLLPLFDSCLLLSEIPRFLPIIPFLKFQKS